MPRKRYLRWTSVFVLAVALLALPDRTVAQPGGGGCTAGGPGATQCTINFQGGGGCSVTCGGGYYACCSAEGCKCVLERQT